MKKLLTIALALSCLFAHAQDTLGMTPEGIQLRQYYLSLDVEHLWIAGHHIDWQTGMPDKDNATQGIKTHCSAFAAEATYKLGIYLLRPPQHGQVLLANAQFDWLQTPQAAADGWRLLVVANAEAYAHAQQLANSGSIVVAVCKNPLSNKPGHIAVIMPSNRALTDIITRGPDVIMAGTHNYNDIDMRLGFKSHITTWPEPGILVYYNIHPSTPMKGE